VRHHPRLDDNQREIVAALRAAGATVQSLAAVGGGCPDLLVGYRGATYCLEVKDGKKPPARRRLTDAEQRWQEGWQGHYQVVESIAEAMAEVFSAPMGEG
jgi:hypothetical protein